MSSIFNNQISSSDIFNGGNATSGSSDITSEVVPLLTDFGGTVFPVVEQNYTITLVRVGRLVTLYFPRLTDVAAGGKYITVLTPIPSRFLPQPQFASSTFYSPIILIANSLPVSGLFAMNGVGNITITFSTPPTFSSGFAYSAISWISK